MCDLFALGIVIMPWRLNRDVGLVHALQATLTQAPQYVIVSEVWTALRLPSLAWCRRQMRIGVSQSDAAAMS